MHKITLNDEHIAAVERQRRIVINFDVSYATNTCSQHYDAFDAYVESLFTFTDADGSQIDSIWWNWSEGNQVPYKSEFLPLFDDPRYQQWVADSIDIIDIEMRVNNILLTSPVVENGWLVYRQVPPAIFAAGENLIGVCTTTRTREQETMQIEKLELHVRYCTV